MCVFCDKVKEYLMKVLYGEAILLDEEGNLLWPSNSPDDVDGFAQNAHGTISMRLAKMRERGSKFGDVCCKVLTWIANRWPFNVAGDHCTNSLKGFPNKLPTDG